jgi:precorrin-2 dehydrogenase / sirohydrochlorin ferrochelatase
VLARSSRACLKPKRSPVITPSGSPICRVTKPRPASANVLINVEDCLPLCDFHTPAVVRRGKLTLTAGTGGASPAVARAARERLEEAFPNTWEAALDEIAQARTELRARSASFDALVADARERLSQHGLI